MQRLAHTRMGEGALAPPVVPNRPRQPGCAMVATAGGVVPVTPSAISTNGRAAGITADVAAVGVDLVATEGDEK